MYSFLYINYIKKNKMLKCLILNRHGITKFTGTCPNKICILYLPFTSFR